jgi:membrane protein
MNKKLKNIYDLFRQTIKNFGKDDTFVLGAALSYYTVFSIAPVLIIVIAVTGMIFGKEAVTGQIYAQLNDIVGAKGAAQMQEIVANAYKPRESVIATVIAIGLLIFGATTVFYQLQSALNKIWEVKPEPKRGWYLFIKDRVLSFGLIIGIGFLLLVSLVLNAAMVALSGWLTSLLPDYSIYLFRVLNIVLSLGIITLLFAMIYKFLPDAVVRWRDVWVGSAFTAVLFMIGHFLISLYLGHSNIGSTYGATGTIVLILVWVSYSSQILFFGAEFTQVYAQRYGRAIVPAPYAKRIRLVAVEQAEGESATHFEKKAEIIEEKIKPKPAGIDPENMHFEGKEDIEPILKASDGQKDKKGK